MKGTQKNSQFPEFVSRQNDFLHVDLNFVSGKKKKKPGMAFDSL